MIKVSHLVRDAAILKRVHHEFDEPSDAESLPRWPSVLLVGSLGVALLWANFAPHSYHVVISAHVGSVLSLPHLGTAEGWINDVLMVVFFLAVGLEVGHERRHGALAENRSAVSPVLAALGGMAVAAMSYFLVALSWHGDATVVSGWGIPMATDIAFALGGLQLLGARVPTALRVFVLALAVADDVFSVIALGITSAQAIAGWWALASVVVILSVIFLRRKVMARWPYLVATALLWFTMAKTGVEPILAGAIVGALVPTTEQHGHASTSTRLLRPVAFVASAVVLPLFVLANAGVELSTSAFHHTNTSAVVVALLVARTAGKVVGIVATVYVLHSTGVLRLGNGITMGNLIGASLLCGVGFTVPLLYAGVAFAHHEDLFAAAQLGLLLASLIGLVGGLLVLVFAARRTKPTIT